ncbi:MAG: hypothetical protein Q8N53_04645, partial [Longimicrobiales bacterium]|nr:hypothetical protein [Longimicrobiales bacterium]
MTREGRFGVGRWGWELVVLVALLPGPVAAQDGPPKGAVPAPVVAPAIFDAAVTRGSRTQDGRPGASYWANRADYDLRARLDPATARLEGSADIRYVNNAPMPLR